jgi:hypothetical protein
VLDPAHLRRFLALACIAAILLAAAAPASGGILFAIAVPILILSAPETVRGCAPAGYSLRRNTLEFVSSLSGRAPPPAW